MVLPDNPDFLFGLLTGLTGFALCPIVSVYSQSDKQHLIITPIRERANDKLFATGGAWVLQSESKDVHLSKY